MVSAFITSGGFIGSVFWGVRWLVDWFRGGYRKCQLKDCVQVELQVLLEGGCILTITCITSSNIWLKFQVLVDMYELDECSLFLSFLIGWPKNLATQISQTGCPCKLRTKWFTNCQGKFCSFIEPQGVDRWTTCICPGCQSTPDNHGMYWFLTKKD